jgi:sugar phosphate isomerase/epimerase
MKLGLSQACYRWVVDPHLRRDAAGYLTGGERLPYFSSLPLSVDEAEAPEWLIGRCHDLGLAFLYLTTSPMGDPTRADRIRRYGADRGVALIGGAHANWVATGDAWRPEYERYVAQVPIAAAAGARILCTTHGAPAVHNHFTKRPPVEQIEIMIANFRRVVPVVADHGLVIAFENHMDYRVGEIARVIEGDGSPALRATFGTANPVGVIEDPVDAARTIARYTVTMHLKDFRIQPATQIGEPRIFWAPLGRGDIELERILAVVQAQAPDPANLPLCLEVAPPPRRRRRRLAARQPRMGPPEPGPLPELRVTWR